MDLFYDELVPQKTKKVRLAVMELWKAFENSTRQRAPQAAIEREIGAKVGFVIDYAERSSPEERSRALGILERYEAQAATESPIRRLLSSEKDFL